MPIYNKIADGLDEVDIIIAGGGAAGCVVAGRISAADPSLVVLLIEGGESNYMKDNVINPSLFQEHLYPGSKTAIFYKTVAQPELDGREVVLPTGGILGGGTSINFMLYTRPQRTDLESWNTPGWAADDLIKHMNHLETFHGPGNPKAHGHDGPVHASDGGYRSHKTTDDVLEATRKYGYPTLEDIGDFDSDNGFAKWPKWISPEGKRQDAAHTFVHPLIQDDQHESLHVLCQSKVNRVLFDENNRAYAVEYFSNPDYHFQISSAPDNVKRTVKARKLVVLSCGACATPPILERSGVGQAEILKKFDIPVVSDLYGVGQEYQDHNMMLYPYRTNFAETGTESMDALWAGRLPRDEAISKKMEILRWNGIDIASKIRPTEAEVKALGPGFEKAWNKDFRDNENKPLMMVAFINGFVGDPSTVDPGQYATLGTWSGYRYSKGNIHIRGNDWSDGVDFHGGFFTDPNDIDLKSHIWVYKTQREIVRRTSLYRGELEIGHPNFPADSAAACKNLSDTTTNGTTNGTNGDHEVRNIEYTPEDDAAIVKFIKANLGTTWHSMGTAKMAPQSENGVVDPELNVYGVSGLKVVDLSIVPENLATNTMSVALMVGEKGAEIILKELGVAGGLNNELYKGNKLAYI